MSDYKKLPALAESPFDEAGGQKIVNRQIAYALENSGSGDGESAYEIAVKNGFVGTEQEWLDSLKGKEQKAGFGLHVGNGYVSLGTPDSSNKGHLVKTNDNALVIGEMGGSNGLSYSNTIAFNNGKTTIRGKYVEDNQGGQSKIDLGSSIIEMKTSTLDVTGNKIHFINSNGDVLLQIAEGVYIPNKDTLTGSPTSVVTEGMLSGIMQQLDTLKDLVDSLGTEISNLESRVSELETPTG